MLIVSNFWLEVYTLGILNVIWPVLRGKYRKMISRKNPAAWEVMGQGLACK